MKPIVVSITGVTNSAPIPMNTYASPFNVGFGVIVSGACNYTVQHTFDDVWTGTPTKWFDHPTIAAKTTDQDGNYAFPVTAIRVVGNATTTGTITLKLVQAGSAAAS